MNRFSLTPLPLLFCAALTLSAPSELEQLVSALQAKYGRLTSLAADFTQIYTAPGERTRRESGHLLLKKPGKMRWDYTAPETKLYVSDGKLIYEYLPAERLATRTKVKETNDLRAPFMFLLGRGDLRRDFKRIEFASEAPARAGHRVLRLFPKRAQEFRELLLEVEPRTLQLARLSLIDQNGARSDFLFSNVRENAAADDAQFIFKPPAGVEVRGERYNAMTESKLESKLDLGRLRIFTDFDGTITERDTLIFLAERLGGGPQMVQTIGRLIREGKLSLREGIAGEMRSIRAPFAEARSLLCEEVKIDPGFAAFARWCVEHRIPLTVLSAGFKEIVDLFISPAEFPGLEIRANTLRPDEQRGWQCVFRDQTPFGHDKAQALGEAREQGHYVIFIGDGLSDRAPAEVADEVFAKPDLAEYCRSRGIHCHEYQTFDDVLRQLQGRI